MNLTETVDAYAHIGYPRYGRPEELVAVWKQWGIGRGNAVLPPGMPDFAGLAEVRRLMGDQTRLFGIPYGDSPVRRQELAELQVEFGVSGMRFMPNELAFEEVLTVVGRNQLCLMAINVYDDPAIMRRMIDWLERYPGASIAAPHFLKPKGPEAAGVDIGLFSELLRAPGMHVILSRHGGASAEAYPHPDLRPWTEFVLTHTGKDRVMWGSEIPVIFHRDEQVNDAHAWLCELGVTIDDEFRRAYYYDNAERLFFSAPPPEANDVRFPAWVGEGLDAFIRTNSAVPVVRTKALELPLEIHGKLMSEYLEAQAHDPSLQFRHWLADRITRIGD